VDIKLNPEYYKKNYLTLPYFTKVAYIPKVATQRFRNLRVTGGASGNPTSQFRDVNDGRK
jgi:hypothetical protein